MTPFPNIPDIGERLRTAVEQIQESPPAQLIQSIEDAWENERNHEFIILSNIYVETLMLSILESRWNQKGLSDKEIGWLSGKSHGKKLNLAKELDILDEPTHTLLKDLNSARNEYAHSLETFSGSYQTKIEREGKLQEVHDFLMGLPANPSIVSYDENSE